MHDPGQSSARDQLRSDARHLGWKLASSTPHRDNFRRNNYSDVVRVLYTGDGRIRNAWHLPSGGVSAEGGRGRDFSTPKILAQIMECFCARPGDPILRTYIEAESRDGYKARDVLEIQYRPDGTEERRVIVSFPPGTPVESVPETIQALRQAHEAGRQDANAAHMMFPSEF